MFDTHCHLQADAFDADRDAVIAESIAAGVSHFIVPATDTASFAGTLDIAEKHQNTYCALGIHPHSAMEWNASVRDRIAHEIGRNPKVRAIGEIGLDYHYDFSPRDVQRKSFSEQIELAQGLGKPIIIHTRESDEDVFRIVEEHYGELVAGSEMEPRTGMNGHFHCFSGDVAAMEKAISLGFMVSFTGNITFKKSTLDEVVRLVPLTHFMIETDSPYLAPTPFRGKRNSPLFLRIIAEKIAEIKAIDVSIVMKSSFDNALKLFSIPRAAVMLFAILTALSVSTPGFAQRGDPAGKAPPDSVLTAERRKAEDLRKKQELELAKEAELHRQDSIRQAELEQEAIMAKAREQSRQDSIRIVERLAEEERNRLFLLTPMPWRAIGIGGGAGIGSTQISVNKPTLSPTSVLVYGFQASTAITRRLDFEVGYSYMKVSDVFPMDSVYSYGPGTFPSFRYNPRKTFNSDPKGVTWLLNGEDLGISLLSFDFRYVITQPTAWLSFYLGLGYTHIAFNNTQTYHVMKDSVTPAPELSTFQQLWSRGSIKVLFGMRHDFELGQGMTIEPFAQIAAISALSGENQDNGFVFAPDRQQIIMTHLNIGFTLYYGWFGVPRVKV